MCVSGSFRIDGECTFCQINAYFDGTKCTCLKGFIGNGIVCRKDPNFNSQGLTFVTSTSASDSSSNIQNIITSLTQSIANGPIILGTISINWYFWVIFIQKTHWL